MNSIYLQPYELPPGEKMHIFEHRLGRRLLCFGLKDRFGLTVTPEWLEESIVAPEGKKPFISGHPEIHYNISHCAGLVVLAFSDGPVGVDAEKIRPVKDSLIRRVLTESEQTFLYKMEPRDEWFTRFWTLKESYLKYTGDGLAGSLTSVSFSFPEDDPENENPSCSDPSVTMFAAKLPGGIILSACTASPEPFALHHLKAVVI